MLVANRIVVDDDSTTCSLLSIGRDVNGLGEQGAQ